jgi:uncharacterized protein (TIGR02391 family)
VLSLFLEMAAISPFELNVLERICDVLADTGSGLTGTEIGRLLKNLQVADPLPEMTKRRRLYEALRLRQEQDRCWNLVIAFIQNSMDPVRHTGAPGRFETKREELNQILAFVGYELTDHGKIQICTPVQTLTEAQRRANRLRADLEKRGVHSDVLKACRIELLQENYFHVVLEATKSIAQKLRDRTGLNSDGSELADAALALGKHGIPLLAFNTLQTESERSEQNGILNLIKGLFGTFRNPTAHAPKISWNMTEPDALDLLTMASFIHRRGIRCRPKTLVTRMPNRILGRNPL